jgi:hypothetical protein
MPCETFLYGQNTNQTSRQRIKNNKPLSKNGKASASTEDQNGLSIIVGIR